MVLSPGHTTPSEIAERLFYSVSQDGGELLPHVFTIITLHILTELPLPSPLLENFQAGSVFTSARVIQNTTSGVLNRLWNTFLHSAQLRSAGSLPVNLLLYFVILLIAQGHWFPCSSSHKWFYFSKSSAGTLANRVLCYYAHCLQNSFSVKILLA